MTVFFNSDLSVEQFLADYWQQQPLLIRDAFPDLNNPISPEELAGLACEPAGNSRLVLERSGERNWVVEYGPFDEQRFAALPETGWSLLVSDVERLLPEARHIQQQFRFLPDWRMDDVMFSYAPEGGSVGAHLDAYDVFLLQTYGTRRWSIAQHFSDACLKDTDLAILEQFDAEHEWTLQPGDMLYLPPNIAHHGIALEPCMTCSIGFRAPSAHDMSDAFINYVSSINTDTRYTDAHHQQQAHPAEISQHSIQQVRDIMQQALRCDDADFSRWFGEFISDSRSQFDDDPQEATSASSLNALSPEATVCQHPDCRFLFSRNDDGSSLVYVNGESFQLSHRLAEKLTAQDQTDLASLQSHITDDNDRHAIEQMLGKGYLLTDHD